MTTKTYHFSLEPFSKGRPPSFEKLADGRYFAERDAVLTDQWESLLDDSTLSICEINGVMGCLVTWGYRIQQDDPFPQNFFPLHEPKLSRLKRLIRMGAVRVKEGE